MAKQKKSESQKLDEWLDRMHKKTGLSKATLYYARGLYGISSISK